MSKQRFVVSPGATIVRKGRRKSPGDTFVANNNDPAIRRLWRSGAIQPMTVDETENPNE